MVEDRSRPMEPEFDPFPMDVPDHDPSPPIVVGFVEGEEGTVLCDTGQQMADSFGSPIFVPRQWPDGAVVEQRVVVRPGSVRADRDRQYIVVARAGERSAPLIVHGYFGVSPYRKGMDGCWAPLELGEVDGMVFEGPGSVNLTVGHGKLCVLLMNFPSTDAALLAAQSLERFEPSGR